MDTARPLDPGFSTTDAELPELQYDGEVLVAKFRDWRERWVTVRFLGVYAFRWQGIEILLESEPYDGSCEIENSKWLAEHIRQSIVDNEGRDHHHYRFNFNAVGSLDVICSSYSVEVN
ncbi:hypothetical protein [Aeoliella sp.]|uniref:hypothetical protein n=1 Tax=Aeoliella sp. TaxID=2795800 RepID=UPI003CCBBB18